MIERGDPLFAQKKRPVLRKSKHVPLVKARTSILEEDASHDRTETRCFAHKTRLKHVSLVTVRTLNLGEKANHDKTVRPVVCREPVAAPSTFNEVDIDFRISGLPHSVVKQAEYCRVRQLVKKIEDHPHRQDLQADLQQNNAYNPF